MMLKKKRSNAYFPKVELISHTYGPLDTVFSAAKQCYSSEGAYDISTDSNYDGNYKQGLIKACIKSGHLSILEHASFTFAIENISRACSHQLVRHRIASYSQQSQRYTDGSFFGYIMPESIRDSGLGLDYQLLLSDISRLYKKMIESGIDKEDARYILPNACETKIVLTMNCRSLLNFFELRCCNRAQWEIRDLANAMLGICKGYFPAVFDDAGAKCKRLGFCPEKQNCGKMNKNKNKS